MCFSPTVVSLDWTAAAILRFPLLGSTNTRIPVSALCHALQAPSPKGPQVTMQSSWQPSVLPWANIESTKHCTLRAGEAWTKGQSREQVSLQWLQPNSTSTYPHSTKVPHFLDQTIWILLVFLFSLHWWHRRSLSQSCFGWKRDHKVKPLVQHAKAHH